MIDEDKRPSDAVAQAKARTQRIANAFVAVFGKGDGRSAEQKLVLEHLETCAGDDGNSYRFNDARDGVALIAAGIHRDGARSILRIIERQCSLAEKPDKSVANPKTKR